MSWRRKLQEDLRLLPKFARLARAFRKTAAADRDTLGRLVRTQAERHPDKPLLRFEHESVTYGEFDAGANAFAAVMRQAGVGREPIALVMENSPTMLMAQTAAAKVGATAALINTQLSGSSLTHALRLSDARHVFTDAGCLPRVVAPPESASLTIWGQGDPAQLPPHVEPLDAALAAAPTSEPPEVDVRGGDIFLYIYTSGTTGYPKPAIVRHSRYTLAGIVLGGLLGIRDDDVVYAPLPLYHGESNLVGFSVALRAGATFASRQRFSARGFIPDICRHDATVLVYVGELGRYVLRQPPTPYDRGHKLRLAVGAGMRPDIWERFRERFGVGRIVEMYGLTEGNVNLLNLDGPVGSVGRAHPCQHGTLELARYDVANAELERDAKGFLVAAADGEVGELLCRISKRSVMRYEGYTDRKASEARIERDAFRRGDQYFRTGDLLRRDSDGYFYFVDRASDTFRWQGQNVSTQEVAGILNDAPGITESNVYGVALPGAEGRVGMAAVVLAAGTDFDAPAFYAATEHLPPASRPAFVRVVSVMDATGTLKQRKVELQRQGFDMRRITDPLYIRSEEAQSYLALDRGTFEKIRGGRMVL